MLLTFSIISRTYSSKMDSFNKAIVTSSQKLIEHYVLGCQKGLNTLASEKNFRHAVMKKDSGRIKINLKRVFIKYKNFSFLGVVGKENDKLYMMSTWPSNYDALTDKKDIYDFLKFNFSNPAERISGVYYFRGRKEVFIVYPLKKALLIGGVYLENLSQLLKKVKPVEESSFILLDDESNYIIGGDDSFTYELPDEEGAVMLADKKDLIYYVYNKVVKWWIILSSPYNVVYRSSIYLRRLVIVFIVLSIAAALLLAAYFSKLVNQPISYLNKGARILGSGNLSYRIRLNTGDELEELAKEFNSMGEELKKSYDSLGEKIKNATRDLEDAYKEIDKKNKALQRADRLKSEFLASMSHELRTPMNAIIGFTSLLDDGVYGKVTKKQKNTYEKIMRNTRHLLNLINDILDLSKIEAGRMKLVPEDVKLSMVLNDLAEEVRPLASEKELGFEIQSDEDIQCFHDYTRLRQIIMNLLSNAIKFTREGMISVRTEKLEDKFMVEVKDTGIGIKEEDQKHIFDEFVQADGSITREFGGTGLGLSICNKLIKMMGGRIEVESQWEVGTAFRVFLPYVMEQGEDNEDSNSRR
jgi:signal transduction histidine kinase